ncbi:MAG: BglG family transcription antiterminator [Pseudobutyrivibrio sp.]|nr:BglG family transcription antiterminator [Pseudobutyrivibrio sp.]
MDITPRIKQIIINLLSAKQPMTDQEMADALGVSKRTILREADYVAEVVRDYNLTLVRKKGEGSFIEGSQSDKDAILNSISTKKELVVTDKVKRRNLLKLELLRNREPQKLFYFSNLFGVSEATISTDLDALESWAKECYIDIVKKPGFGIMLSASEKNYRLAMQRFVTETMRADDMEEVSDNIYSLMNEGILAEVGTILSDIDEPYLRNITNDAYVGLLVHLAVAVERIQQGKFVTEETYDASLDKGYDIAKKIGNTLEEAFSINIPEAEINNILLHIRGAKFKYSNDKGIESIIQADELIGIVEGMIEAIDSDYASEIKYEDDFITGLMVHLETALYRMKNDMPISNPLLPQIIAEYPEVYQDCKKASQVIFERTGLMPNDAEIGYLCMHFGAAKEKIDSRKRKRRTVNIGVICASGFGVAQLMMAKLKNQFANDDIVIKAYGFDEITEHIMSRTDFFISILEMEDFATDYIMVNPMLNQKDILQISAKIDEYSSLPARQADTDFTRQLDEINDVIIRLKGIIRKYHHLKINPLTSFEQMVNFFATNMTESPKAAAVLHSEIMAREAIMSQVFPEIGIALLHARSRAVKECMVISAAPEVQQEFADPKLKGIGAVLCMIMPLDSHRKENSEMLGRISSAIVEDENFLEAIKKGEEAQVRNKLQKILKGYFTEQLSSF